ncbi:MAG TPA: CsiV family protein [Steroidobacteraceae bacterium]|nr:CsiV family protein [Steroidobacteraceae bacterium]
MHKWISVSLLTIALGASAAEPARQSDSAYSVELIVFRPTTPLGVAEDWQGEALAATAAHVAADSAEPNADVAVPASGSVDASPMSPALFKLSGIESGLQRSHNYEVLGHVGWTQTVVARGSGLAIDLSQLGLGGEVRGTASVERGRYLYLRLKLAYTPAAPPASLVGTTAPSGPVTFTLDQVRRVRNFERHYFDHPAFGVIAMVSPIGGAH